MGGREYAAIAGPDGPTGIEDLCAVVAAGLFVLPCFAAGGPFVGVRGIVRGTPSGQAQLTALAELYCALMTCECLALTGPVRKLYVDGPFATHPLYLGALATLPPETRILAAQDRHGTGIGAALLAQWPSKAGLLPDSALATQDIPALDLDLAPYQQAWRGMDTERMISGG